MDKFYAYDLHTGRPYLGYAYANRPVCAAAVAALNTNNGELRYILLPARAPMH